MNLRDWTMAMLSQACLCASALVSFAAREELARRRLEAAIETTSRPRTGPWRVNQVDGVQ